VPWSGVVFERLHRIHIAAPDPATAAHDFAQLLGCAPPRVPSASVAELEVGATRLAFGASGDGPEGMRALEFAVDDVERARARLEPAATRGIAIEVCAGERAVSAPPPLLPGAERLDHAVVLSGDLEAAKRLYGGALGMRLALDRSFPQRGVRILFFRLAGVTIEIAGPLAGAPRSADDRFGGLAWRGSDVDAWRARLVAQGFDVSDCRAGFKPGTRVCSVRDRTHHVPTLLIAPDPDASVSG